MSFIGDWSLISQLVAYPMAMLLLGFPVCIAVIVVATVWTKR